MSDPAPESLLATAREWMVDDPDPATRAELASLVDAAAAGDADSLRELADSFDGTLEFGTAGLRGRMGPGSNRMNRVVVARAAAGLAAYLVERGARAIVIGYDARRQSDEFAHDSARIMAGAGLTAMVLPRPLPTPVTAFAIGFLGVDAAVTVTASHNPPDDNGYKVYLGDGAQIVPPADEDIAACIARVGPIAEIPRSDDYLTLDDGVLDAYIERAEALLPPGPRDVRIVYTPMHGVGGEVFLRAAAASGFPAPHVVEAQFAPDPAFPTVRFPNPEEPGAMDLALAAARTEGADLVIAHDPDADRLAVGIPASPDDYRRLTGDEVGSLLGWWVIERARRGGETLRGTFAESLVSGTLLKAIASDAGLDCATTLTGFKWIARVPGLVYGYEEALGYCVDPSHVRDKDGITAALLVMEMAAHLAAESRDLQAVLDDIDRQYGIHLTSQVSVRVSDSSLIADAMARLRANPPGELGGRAVIEYADLEQGFGALPPTDGLHLLLDGARVIIRPSGTEPKLKCYLQVTAPADADLEAARRAAEEAMSALRMAVGQALALG